MTKVFLKSVQILVVLSLFFAVGCKKDKDVTSVTLDKINITLNVGETATLTETVHPNDATNKVVSWTSSNPIVAIVDNGLVTARSEGVATITVITEDGKYKTECTVIVIFEEGIVINGTKWATRNVDAPGTFASKPEEAGMFYQWNRKSGWPITGEVLGWDSSDPMGDIWEKANDPCPAGWRIPTVSELQSLVEAGSQWATQNNADGRIFGNGDNTIFLFAAGGRNIDGSIFTDDHSPSTVGYYWSSAPSGEGALNLGFNSISVQLDMCASFRTAGLSVRCVAE